MQEYLAIKEQAVFEFTEKKSRFICTVYPVESSDEALDLLADKKKECWDASHNCSAYIIGAGRECMRFSDDGEPQGTAGVPMLEALKQSGLTNILAVVTRYFGGILLGAGGLVRAYTKSVCGAIECAKNTGRVVRMIPGSEYRIIIPYSGYGKIENMIASEKCIKVSSEFGEKIDAVLAVPDVKEEVFLNEISEAFLGSIIPEKLEEKYIVYPF